jgi:hypothetical protein
MLPQNLREERSFILISLIGGNGRFLSDMCFSDPHPSGVIAKSPALSPPLHRDQDLIFGDFWAADCTIRMETRSYYCFNCAGTLRRNRVWRNGLLGYFLEGP